MPKKINKKSLFLNTVQKLYNISDKEMAESEIWIDGFKNALKAAEKVGMFSEWQPIETAPTKDQPSLLLYGLMCDGDGKLMGNDDDTDIHIEVGYYIPPEIARPPKENFNYACFDNRMKPTHWMLLPKPPTK